jgi:hypothetical protein
MCQALLPLFVSFGRWSLGTRLLCLTELLEIKDRELAVALSRQRDPMVRGQLVQAKEKQQEHSTMFTLECCAKMYYTNIEPDGFNFHLYMIPNFELIRDIEAELGKRERQYEDGPYTAVELEKDEITLIIPKQAVRGWKMDALSPLKMSTVNKSVSLRKELIPFQVRVSWIGDGGCTQKQLMHRVRMIGVKKGYNFLTVTAPRRFCTGSTSAEGPAAGLAILVTCDYEANSTLKTLKGTNVDADEMRVTFEQFNYEIHQLRNGEATKNAITSLLSDISQRLIEEYNAKVVGPRKVIIFAFSGHGSEFDEIYASDGELYSL